MVEELAGKSSKQTLDIGKEYQQQSHRRQIGKLIWSQVLEIESVRIENITLFAELLVMRFSTFMTFFPHSHHN
ncbi:MAG: hypothetical protein ACI909_001518 [Planctomycetota bacterium]|jgi:hypothetical protein